ncbi:MAG: addiction module protein [Candidatus Riflebacteria bacterium HGW-Riflebacteria-1]|nr:MAG: addiction module protein [Candidatus Riflebacteria bacterium HGW-Riflebacteria-1]
MKPSDIVKEIEKLNLSEKLLLVEDIWDTIARSNASLPLPEWQKQELAKRQAEYENGGLRLYKWQSVHEKLRIS